MQEIKKKKNEYTQISIPKKIRNDAEEAMDAIGCRTMTSFASMALKEYISKIQAENNKNLKGV